MAEKIEHFHPCEVCMTPIECTDDCDGEIQTQVFCAEHVSAQCDQREQDPSRPTVLLCDECQSVHFNVARPLQFSDIWKVCCEGCGAIYDLLPTGDVQLHSR